MKHIQIKGLNKPVSKLIMGSDFFRLDNGQEVSDILGHYLAIGGNTIDYCIHLLWRPERTSSWDLAG